MDTKKNQKQNATVQAYCHGIDEFLVTFKESRDLEAVTISNNQSILGKIYHLKTGDAKSAIIKYLVSHDEIFEIFTLVWKIREKGNISTSRNKVAALNLSIGITNLIDCSDEFAYAFGEKGLLTMVIRDLQTKNFVGDNHIDHALNIIYNCCRRIPENRVMCREFVVTLQECSQSKNPEIQAHAFLALSFIVDKSDIHKISLNEPCLKFLLLALKSAMSEPDGRSRDGRYSTLEVLQGLNQLAINDCNKLLIVKLGGLVFLEQILMKEGSNDEEMIEAARGIWQLAFKKDNLAEMHQRTTLLNTLKKIKETTEDCDVKEACSGALFVVDDESKGHTSTHGDGGHSSMKSELSSGHEEGHIMISYQWESQERMLLVKSYLEECGYNVWMDVEKMKGDILDGMAAAVQEASVVLVCVSRKYEASQNCRTEAKYAYKENKDIIPLILQDQFAPKGWLGCLMGTKKYYPMFSDDHMEKSLPDLVRELGDKGKRVKLGEDSDRGETDSDSGETDSDSGESVVWDEEDAIKWLILNGVDTSMW